MFRLQDVLYGIFILILLYLILVNWRGTNSLVQSGGRASIGIIKTLQGR